MFSLEYNCNAHVFRVLLDKEEITLNDMRRVYDKASKINEKIREKLDMICREVIEVLNE